MRPRAANTVDTPSLSIVIPVFNEAGNIDALWVRLAAVLTGIENAEVLFVDDGSRDATPDLISKLAQREPRVAMLRLSRNFGHQAALFAGLEQARGEAVITLDGDLQHPPELITDLIRRWREGFEIVQAIRTEPADESALKRFGSKTFYRLLSGMSRIQVTPGAADFRLMSREAVDAFLCCRERCRFNRALVQWIGFRYCEVTYRAQPRHAGKSKYSYRAMVRLAGDAVFSFSSWPLRLAGLAGVAISLAACLYLLFVLWATAFTTRTVPGWSSILAAVLVLGGVQLVVLWIIGEYLGRLYEESKHRPIYIARAAQGESSPASRAAPAAPSHVRDSGPPQLNAAQSDAANCGSSGKSSGS